MGSTKKSETPRAWQPFAGIIIASALAHLWCLGSQFFLDDAMFIRHNEVIESGHFWETGVNAWTYLWYVIEHRLFGISAPGFHLVNWLLHTAVACVLFVLGRDLLEDRGKWRMAFFAALLFAVHPLGSEIPNYARTQDLAWVTLFSLLAAWQTLLVVKGGTWKNFAWASLAILGAAFSKGPGLLQALMMAGVVGAAFLQPEYRGLIRRHRRAVAAVLLAGLLALWAVGKWKYGFEIASLWASPRFAGHAFTLGRVFWEFAWRSVIPISLSADHHIAETLVPAGAKFWEIPDHGAIWAMMGLLILTASGVFLAWRKSTRLVGVCLFLFCSAILFRVFYIVPEFMPEYRIYPGLPWFCLGASVVLHAALRKFTEIPPRVPAVPLLLVFIFLSAKRSFLWHDLDLLLTDVLNQYPAQARAHWELDDRDVEAGNWQKIITRQRTDWPEIMRRFMAENQRLAPARELPSGHFALAEVACRGSYALALANTEGTTAGFREMNQQEIYMRTLGLDPKAHAIHWGYFFFYKALILEKAGKDAAAIALLKNEGVPQIGLLALRRLEAKTR